MKIDAAGVAAALFAEHPRAFCEIAEQDGAPVGFAFWFYSYSTFEGTFGIYLEDIFVVPEARGTGAGIALMRRLAQRCRDEGLSRLEWAVLDWNAPGDRLLRPPRRHRENRMDHPPALRRSAGAAGGCLSAPLWFPARSSATARRT